MCLVRSLQRILFITYFILLWYFSKKKKTLTQTHVPLTAFKASCFCGHIFAKDSSLPPVITFSAEELEDAGKERDREREREGERERGERKAILSCLSLSEGLTGREIDHWSMTAQYDPTLSCSMLSVE